MKSFRLISALHPSYSAVRLPLRGEGIINISTCWHHHRRLPHCYDGKKDKLAPGETSSYAIKPLETGMMKVQFTDAQGASTDYNGTTSSTRMTLASS